MSALGRFRTRIVNAALGFDPRRMLIELQETQNQRNEQLAFISRRLSAELELLRAERDDLEALRTGLATVRRSAAYKRSLAQSEPLVSVRIASYEKTEELMDVAIASVLAQTYQRFELIVVNDGPNEKTRAAIQSLGDKRIRYEEFPTRTAYPADEHARWMIAGARGMNHAASLAVGDWIAPLDDDDAFTPDHLEKLIALAQEHQVELAYGALEQNNLVTGRQHRIFSSPPAIGQFSFQGAIYLRALNEVFQYDEASWIVDEPGDWNLIRRMTAAGVSMAAMDEVVAVMHQVPYTHKETR